MKFSILLSTHWVNKRSLKRPEKMILFVQYSKSKKKKNLKKQSFVIKMHTSVSNCQHFLFLPFSWTNICNPFRMQTLSSSCCFTWLVQVGLAYNFFLFLFPYTLSPFYLLQRMNGMNHIIQENLNCMWPNGWWVLVEVVVE